MPSQYLHIVVEYLKPCGPVIGGQDNGHGGYGYSIGMSFQPTWTENPHYIAVGSETVLEPGMAFHLPCNAWVPAAKYGIGFSESIAVTADGCETLTPGTDRELAIR